MARRDGREMNWLKKTPTDPLYALYGPPLWTPFMGIAKTPELYQCAVSINGVLNLKSFFSSGRQLLFKTINRAMWNSPDEAEAASPYHLVDNIKAPLMLIAGSRDTVVPYKQSKAMFKKMKKAGKDVELIKLTDGEHWRTNEKHEIKKMKALERFLDEHIGL